MTKLNQILAIEKGVKSQTYSELSDIHQQLQKPVLLEGLSRTYQPKDTEGEPMPAENKKVQLDATLALGRVAHILTKLFDVTATKDYSNCKALADVVVNGKILLEKVPVTYLLFLEKQLVDLHTLFEKLPVLDAAETWAFDESSASYKSGISETSRTKKTLRNHVKYEATKEHPAQVETYNEDVVVGTWTLVKFSGALPQTRVNELLERLATLQQAVKFARENANGTDVTDQSVGEKIFDYLAI